MLPLSLKDWLYQLEVVKLKIVISPYNFVVDGPNVSCPFTIELIVWQSYNFEALELFICVTNFNAMFKRHYHLYEYCNIQFSMVADKNLLELQILLCVREK